MKRWLLALLLVWSSLCSSHAEAQDATSLFRRGAVAFGNEHYAEAATLFAEAHALSGEPGMLYNLALAQDRAGDVDGAIESYRAYLLASPTAPERAEIEQRLTALEPLRVVPVVVAEPIDEPVTEIVEEETPLDPPPPTASHDAGSSVAAAIVLSLGVAGLGVAGGLSWWAGDTHARAVAEPVQITAVAREAEAFDLALAANLTWALAGTALITGIVWLVIDQLSIPASPQLAAGRIAIEF